MSTVLKVWVENLNSKEGGWLDLPATEEEISTFFEYIGMNEICENQYTICNLESDLPGVVLKNKDLDTLNKLAKRLAEAVEGNNLAAFEAITEYCFKKAMDIYHEGDYTFYEGCADYAALGRYLTENQLVDFMFNGCYTETIEPYLDYEKIGRDKQGKGDFFGGGFLEID